MTRKQLAPRIQGFEFHSRTADEARRAVERVLLDADLSWPSARALSHVWVRKRDFLLQVPGQVTHVAANPPYVRWTKLPSDLAKKYRSKLPAAATNGDLAVAFLDRMLAWARPHAKVVALISDRWMFAQYGAEFRKQFQEQGWALRVVDPRPESAFVRSVGAYSAIVSLAQGGSISAVANTGPRERAKKLHAALVARHGTLAEAGCVVRVGPALGSGETFLVSPSEAGRIESELVRSFIVRQGARGEIAIASEKRVVIPYDRSGSAILLDDWPGFAAWARQHEARLKTRSHTRNGSHWWQTIDAIGTQWQQTPKLLVPELCRNPFASLDMTDSIPAHSLYAIWPGAWPAQTLQRVLNAGLLRLTATAEAPMLKQNWYRFYKRFIVRTPLPKWSSLSSPERKALEQENAAQFSRTFSALFGFVPGSLDIASD
ncbi:hypothetical protein [Mesorhizobium sp. B2-4-6]|uniref:Eco57I restriction-modification methylase domain-containing protein n=1 Tax=Mesorhizobium sp. B2-4-6 TaxID=2589943 RepID=UPI00112D7699|nr:hypothetical protein [Mesorhizobium sp. B2-4-6]TPL49893.1 hypothetical protein FJ957_12625 [Mesorhizobium sp. B2-4-6]